MPDLDDYISYKMSQDDGTGGSSGNGAGCSSVITVFVLVLFFLYLIGSCAG